MLLKQLAHTTSLQASLSNALLTGLRGRYRRLNAHPTSGSHAPRVLPRHYSLGQASTELTARGKQMDN